MKKRLALILIYILGLTSFAHGATLPILTAPQGGTGIGTATTSDIGKVLTVSTASPFTYTLSTSSATTINGASGPTFTFNGSQNITISTSTNTVNFNTSQDISSTSTPTFGAVQFDITPSTTNSVEGLLRWNDDDGTLDLGMHGGNVTQQIGQETYFLIKNQTGATILNGRPVMFAGAIGASGRLKGQYAIADGSIPAMYTMGIATVDIANGTDGYVTNFGKVRGIDTTGTQFGEVWADGDILYISPTTTGYLTNVAPQAPNLQITVAAVVNAHATAGELFVRPTWQSKLTDLDDVNGTSLTTDGQFPTWHNTAGYFDFDKNINDYLYKPGISGGQTAIGGTGVADILNLQGTSGNGTLTSPAIKGLVGNNGATTAFTVLNNGKFGIGTNTPSTNLYVVGTTTISQELIVSSLTGILAGLDGLVRTLNLVAPLSYSTTTNNLSISTSTASTDGFLTSTDWNTFNTKVASTTTLTAGAGLTGGGDLSANRTFDIGAGTGITVNANDVALTVPVSIANGGTGTSSGSVLSLTAGTGISVSSATGTPTITNTGVTSLVAGTNITISNATGTVTVNSTGGGSATNVFYATTTHSQSISYTGGSGEKTIASTTNILNASSSDVFIIKFSFAGLPSASVGDIWRIRANGGELYSHSVGGGGGGENNGEIMVTMQNSTTTQRVGGWHGRVTDTSTIARYAAATTTASMNTPVTFTFTIQAASSQTVTLNEAFIEQKKF